MRASHLPIAVLLASWPAVALAQGARVVVVASSDGAAPLAQRLEAELTSLAFAPASVARDGAAPAASEIAEIAAVRESAFVLVVSPTLDAVDVWAIERDTGGATQRGTIAEPGEHPSIAVLAIRTVEYLRALELEVARAAARPSVDVVPAVAATAGSEPALESPGVDARRLRRGWASRRLELGLGVAVQWSPGGVGASGQILAEVAYTFWRWLGVHLLGVVPMAPAVVIGPEGRARIWPGMIGAGLRARLAPRGGRVGFAIDAGVAAAALGMEGAANAPFRSLDDRVWAAAPYVRPRLAVRLLSWLELDVDLLVGLALPQPIVRFATRDAASWGLPFLAVGVGLGGLLL